MTTALRHYFGYYWSAMGATGGITDASNMLMDANGEEVAVKYYPNTTSPITAIDFYFNISGTVSDTNFDYRVESDSSGSPSGSVLGAACTKFAGPAADGWTGAKSLATNSGNLTLGTPVWLICRRVDGGDLSGTDKVQFSRVANNPGFVVMRHYNGADWTTTAALTTLPLCIATHADGSFGSGFPQNGTGASSGYTDIHDTNKQAIKVRFGSKVTIKDISTTFFKSGSPDPISLTIYEGNTPVAGPFTLLNDTNASTTITFLTSAVTLTNDVDVYFVFSQAGTSDANDWDLSCVPIVSGYINGACSQYYRMCYGTGSDPTAFTVVDDKIPNAFYLGLFDPSTDLDVSSASGAGPVFGGMVTSQMLGGF